MARRAKKPRAAFHHGNLREALIEAAIALVEEGGPENVSLREAAKRTGVSSGAPFRHFPSRLALMTAVAEEAMRRLRTGVAEALTLASAADPLIRFRTIGYAYLKWAVHNPAHFQVISDRRLIDFEGSAPLQEDNAAIQKWMSELLEAADAGGLLRAVERKSLLLEARALSYGLARMYVDGHMPQWGVKPAGAMRAMEAVFDEFVEGIASDAWVKAQKRARGRAG